MRDLKYIITGGPGSGKTTLLNALSAEGYACSEEVSRRLIIEERQKGSGCLPWRNLPCFAEKALGRMIEAYESAKADLCFFDRGIPDIVAYLKAAGAPVAEKYSRALYAYPYEKIVFLLPPWEEIYVQDGERWQDFEEAAILYQHLKATYKTAGYLVDELTRCSTEERVAQVLAKIGAIENNKQV